MCNFQLYRIDGAAVSSIAAHTMPQDYYNCKAGRLEAIFKMKLNHEERKGKHRTSAGIAFS